jgi:hypothetical protein
MGACTIFVWATDSSYGGILLHRYTRRASVEILLRQYTRRDGTRPFALNVV